MRIVALLVALASVADCAAGLSGRRRRNMIAGLVAGEAYDFVLGMTQDAEIHDEETELEGDPAPLAAHFRVPALALTMLLAQARESVLSGAAGPRREMFREGGGMVADGGRVVADGARHVLTRRRGWAAEAKRGIDDRGISGPGGEKVSPGQEGVRVVLG